MRLKLKKCLTILCMLMLIGTNIFPDIAVADGQVAAPIFSPGGGACTTTQAVSITSATTGASIRYTTDGSTPTSSSALYTTPVSISGTSKLNAYASLPGMTDSSIMSASYTFNSAISPSAITYNVGISSDIKVTLTLNGNTLTDIKNGTNSLISGTDYTVSGSIVSIKSSYLTNCFAKNSSNLNLSFVFSSGSNSDITIAPLYPAINVMRQTGSVLSIVDGPTAWGLEGNMWPNGINDGSDGPENYSYPGSYLALTNTSGSSYNVGRGNTITFSSAKMLKQFKIYSNNAGAMAVKKYKIDALINGTWQNIAEVAPVVNCIDSHTISELNFLSNTTTSTSWRWYISQWDDSQTTNYYIGEVEAYENPGIVISANFPSQGQILYEKGTYFPSLTLYDLGMGNRTLTCKYFIDSEATPRGTVAAQGSAMGNTISLNQLDTSTFSEGGHTIRFEVPDGTSIKTQTIKFIYTKTINVMRQTGSVVSIVDGPTAWGLKGNMWPNGINDGSDGPENYSYPGSYLALTSASGSSNNVGRGNTITFSPAKMLKQFKIYSNNAGAIAVKKYKIDALINGTWQNIAEVAPVVKCVDSHTISELNFLSNITTSTTWRWYISQWDDSQTTNYYIGEVEACTYESTSPESQTVTLSPTTTTTAAYNVTVPVDIQVAMTLNGDTLTDIKNGSVSLVNGVDYTLSGSTAVIKASYLKTYFGSDHQNLSLSFKFGSGSNSVLLITPIYLNSLLSSSASSFSKQAPADINLTLTLNGNLLTAIQNASYTLAIDKDYTVSGSSITIKSSYLNTLPNGITSLSFIFNGGNNQPFPISVSDILIDRKTNNGTTFPSGEKQITTLYRYPDYTNTPIPQYTRYPTNGNNTITENIYYGTRTRHTLNQAAGTYQYVYAGTNKIMLQSNVPKNIWASVNLYAGGGTGTATYVSNLRLIFDDNTEMTVKDAINNGILSPLCLIHTYYDVHAWTKWSALYDGTQTDSLGYPDGYIIFKCLTKELKGVEFNTNTN